MPSFDIVSEVDLHELQNAVDHANREASNRFDLKNADATVSRDERVLALEANEPFQLEQLKDILLKTLTRRGIDIACLDYGKLETVGTKAKQVVTARHGIETPVAKDIVKRIKASGVKVQAAIQDQQVRVTGKKRDDLQQVISLLKNVDLDLPLQFNNFRD